MHIPSIEFHASTASHSFIEIIDYSELSARRHTMAHHPSEPHRVNFSMLITIEKGTGHHFVDFRRCAFTSGDLIFVRKGQVNSFDFETKIQGSIILFTEDFLQYIQSNVNVPIFSPIYLANNYTPVLQASKTLQMSSAHLLIEIKKEVNNDTSDNLIVMLLFSALFLMIEKERSKHIANNMTSRQITIFIQFMELLERGVINTRNVNDYVEHLPATYKTLNQLCKKVTRLTAKQLIDAYTILEAKRRLMIDKKSIQALADDMGFDEVTNFTKYFKKHTQLTPSAFQKNT